MKIRRIRMIALCGLALGLGGCGTRTPYFLVESTLVESRRLADAADVTETPTFRSVRSRIDTVGLQPPDVCADQGLTSSAGAGELQLGVMRTRCGVEMAELERALARAGYRVVSWNAIRQRATRQEEPLIETASGLGIDVLLQVNALERIDIQPGRDARWERRFYRATRTGERADPAAVSPARARSFERLIASREASLSSGKRVGATINVSAVQVASGATIWFYESTLVDDVAAEPRVQLLADCDDADCREIRKPDPVASAGPVEGSISGVSTAGDPADESQALFSDLVRRLVTDLVERFAGRRS